MDRIEDKKIEKWRGSCYGITLVTILDKLGKIGFNENLKLPADTMYQVSTPISQREILSQINFYQILLRKVLPLAYPLQLCQCR